MTLLFAVLITGCKNSCQQLCAEIRDYASAECNLQFTKDELKTCYQDHAGSGLEKGDQKTCRESLSLVDEEWECDDIADYFDNGGAAAE